MYLVTFLSVAGILVFYAYHIGGWGWLLVWPALSFTLVDRNGRVSASDIVIDGEPMPVPERERGPSRQLTGESATGTVKFFNGTKGFGFIQRDDGAADAFVHISAVERSGLPGLQEGDRLVFDLEVDRRGKYAAVNLRPKRDD